MATGKFFGKHFLALYNEEHDILDDTIKVMLTTSTYTPDQDTHDYKDDVTNEVVGTGYVAAGATLATKTLTYTGATNVIKFDADDVTWDPSSITARHAVVYNATGGGADASRGLIGYVSETGDVTSSSGPFTIVWDASGIFTITVA